MAIVNGENYKEVYKRINEIVTEIDPLYLIGGGAPENEYEPEVNKIILNLSKIENELNIIKIVEKVFEDSFGDMNIDRQKINNICERIKKIWKENN